MKRLTASLVACLLLLSACQSAPAPLQGNDTETPSTPGTEKEAPFNMDYDTQANLDFFLDPESIEFLASGGPYYISPNSLPMPAFTEFNKLKRDKVEEALEVTDELVSRAKNLEAKIRGYEASLFSALGVAVGADKAFADLTTGNVDERAFYVSKEQVLFAYLRSLPLDSEEPYVKAGAEYHKSMLALELGETMLDDYTSVTLNAAQLLEFLQASENETVKSAGADLDKEMESAGDAKADIEAIIAKSAELDTALRQLATGDYYIAQTGLEYMKMEIPKAKTALEGMKATEEFTEEDIEFTKQYLSLYEELANILDEKLSKLEDKDQLLLTKTTGAIPTAHADFWSAYESTKSALSTGVSAVGSGISTVGEYGWAATKATYHGAQRVVGTTVEGVGTVSKSTFDFYSGLYYGNSLADIKARQNENYASFIQKAKDGTAGSETLKLGGEILSKSEEVVGDIVTAPIRYTWGEGYVSWAVGGVAKMGAGAFTSLGKGIFALSNPESTGEDLFWGAFDVGTSVIGGSSSVIKASQVTAGGANAGKNFFQRGVNYLSKLFSNNKAAKLADRMDEIKNLLKQGGLDDKVKEALKKELKQSKYELNRLKNVATAAEENSAALKSELQEGLKNLKQTTKELVKKNLDDQAESISKTFHEEIESSVTGYLKKFLDPISSPANIFDNFVHGELDKWLAGEGKDFISKVLIPWLMGGYDGVYSGNWVTQAGTFPVAVTVAESVITGQGEISYTYAGVHISSTIVVSGKVDGQGNISGTMTQSGNISGVIGGTGGGSGGFTGTIVDGKMTMNYSGSGSTTISAQGYTTTAGGSDAGTIILNLQ